MSVNPAVESLFLSFPHLPPQPPDTPTCKQGLPPEK